VSLTIGGGISAAPAGQRDEAVRENETADKDTAEKKLPWRGSQFIIGQSATTQTVGIGEDFNSKNSVYELSFTLQPRYYVYDGGDHTVNVNARIALAQELTNSDTTTREREVLFENTTLNAVYGYQIYKDDAGYITSATAGPRLVLPTAKDSWNSGHRLQLGVGVGVKQGIPVTGADHEWLPSASFQGGAFYLKHINRTTTAEDPDFERIRQDVGGRTLISNQFGASGKVSHQFNGMLGASLDVTQKLHLGVTYYWILQWRYKFDQTQITDPGTGMTTEPQEYEDATNFRVMPWLLASVDYDLLPEVGLGVSYYNVTTQLGEDGQRRNPLWSPDARVAFDITANLDEIYMTLAGSRKDKASAAANARARQQARASTLQTASTF
jgi:hypothetical protein